MIVDRQRSSKDRICSCIVFLNAFIDRQSGCNMRNACFGASDWLQSAPCMLERSTALDPNYLREKILCSDLDPDALPEFDVSKTTFADGNFKPKACKEMWGAGQG
jgi:hypothetical protein